MEHVSRFRTQCGESSKNEYHMLQLFSLSFTDTTFTWYSILLPNSIENSDDMERCFHDRFYSPQLEVFVADLMNIKQHVNELVVEYLERLRHMKSKCHVLFPKDEYANIVVRNMQCQLMEKMILQDFVYLGQLMAKALKIEQCVHESNHKKAQTNLGGMQNMSIIDSNSKDSLDEEMTAK